MGVEAIRRLLAWIRLNADPCLDVTTSYRPVIDHVLEIVHGLLPGRHFTWGDCMSAKGVRVHFELDEEAGDLGAELREFAKAAAARLQHSSTSHWNVMIATCCHWNNPCSQYSAHIHPFVVYFDEHEGEDALSDVDIVLRLVDCLRYGRSMSEEKKHMWRVWTGWSSVVRKLPSWALRILEAHGYI